MNNYCTVCGKNHPDVTGGCTPPIQSHFPETTIHYTDGRPSLHSPARTVSGSEWASEVCPTCNGSGRISAVIRETLTRIKEYLKV